VGDGELIQNITKENCKERQQETTRGGDERGKKREKGWMEKKGVESRSVGAKVNARRVRAYKSTA